MTLTLEQSGAPRAAVIRPSGVRAATTRRWLPAAAPGLLMLALGLLGSTRPVLSWDEIATADVAGRSVPQIWQLVHHIDGVFGPYYLLMHLWTTLAGDSVLSLRFPSILAMAGAAAVTGELGRRLAGTTAGTVAGVLLCLLPNMSRYAAEARPYAMACLFSVLALLLLYRACERPSLGRWVAYAGAIAGMGSASLVAMTALSGHLVLLLLRVRTAPHRWRSLLLPWSAAALGTVTVLVPLIHWGWQQRPAQLHWMPPLTLGGVYKFPELLVGSPEVAWLLIGLLVVAGCRRTRPIIEMVVAALLPAGALLAVSAAGPSFWINRYLLFVLSPAVIAAAAGLARSHAGRSPRRWGPELAAVLAVAVAAAFPWQIVVRQPTVKNGSDYRTVAAVIRARQQPGDVLVYSKGRTMRAGVDYYLRTDHDRPRDVLLHHSAAQTATLTADEYADPVARLRPAGRIWLVGYGRPANPAAARKDLRTMLQDDYQRVASWRVKNGLVALYSKRPGSQRPDSQRLGRDAVTAGAGAPR